MFYEECASRSVSVIENDARRKHGHVHMVYLCVTTTIIKSLVFVSWHCMRHGF
jgi:hypothetical protein